jgi:type IV pilus assembly protein PilE
MKMYSGFTLIEMMITVAIIGILSAIAMPIYSDYVIRSRLADAFSQLSTSNSSAEQFWSNNRTYVGMSMPAPTANFTYSVSNQTTSTYTIAATGIGLVAGFVFTINQDGTKATTSIKAGWGSASLNCWVNAKGGCTQ